MIFKVQSSKLDHDRTTPLGANRSGSINFLHYGSERFYWTLKHQQKTAPENDICFSHLLHIFANIIANVSIEVNSVDPFQTAPTGVGVV